MGQCPLDLVMSLRSTLGQVGASESWFTLPARSSSRSRRASHASLSDADKRAMGLGPELVRLCFGLENPDDLRRDLAAAFDALAS